MGKMKKWVIGALVGAIIVFAWQFLSWMLLGLHDKEHKYLEKQDEIMSVLSANIPAEGMYMVPNLPADASWDDHKQHMEKVGGKPWATIVYHNSLEVDMARHMIRGFLIDFSLVILLIFILTRAGTPTTGRIVGGSVAIGFFTWLWGPYTGHNWYDLPWDMLFPTLIDAIVAWALCGLWIGWWLNRRKAVHS
jgi:hypothetical protein